VGYLPSEDAGSVGPGTAGLQPVGSIAEIGEAVAFISENNKLFLYKKKEFILFLSNTKICSLVYLNLIINFFV
jgi:hypothetical protein